MPLKNIVSKIVFLIALAAFIYSSVQLAGYFREANKQDTLLESIQANVYETTAKAKETTVSLEPTEPEVTFDEFRMARRDNLFELYKQNNDLIGWIKIDDMTNPENTIIDYPVMQTILEPDYYLKRDFNKKKSSYGTIYMDANCSPRHSKNLLIYGHHMKNGSMFASLNKYTDPSYYSSHPFIQFDTLSILSDYQIIGAFKATSKELSLLQDFLLLSTEEEFNTFRDHFESHKFYDTGIPYSYEDDFITLMTCEYTSKNGRFFVVGKKIKTKTIEEVSETTE